MTLSQAEIPIVLQGPKPHLPAGFWESSWAWVLLLAAVAIGLALLVRFLFRRRVPPIPPPLEQLQIALRLAESQPPAIAISQATLAFRAYLAAIDSRAAASLSTEELIVAMAAIPVFLPARQPLCAMLRAADAAKFGGAKLEPSFLIAGICETTRRIEDARQTFARPPSKPALRLGAPLTPPSGPISQVKTGVPWATPPASAQPIPVGSQAQPAVSELPTTPEPASLPPAIAAPHNEPPPLPR